MSLQGHSGNLFDYFEHESDGDGGGSPWAARAPRRPNERFDMLLRPRSPEWREDPDSLAALDRIEEQPWVDAVRRTDRRVELRLSDGWIEQNGAALEAGGGSEASLAGLARSRRFAVQFWDANATKALHVGHLRNLAIGNALASALTQAGGEVERRSLISDSGRSMGEAMAGVVQSGRHAQSWPEGGQKSDHFVGVCYADYVASGGLLADQEIEEPEDSLARELRLQNDAADELLKRVLAGEDEALELWFKTRAWVIAGQRKTLARLGISFDRVFYESDFLADAAELTAAGLQTGRLRRRDDGVVTYATGVEDLKELPLVRSDGVATQHLRAVAYWMTAPDLEGVTTLQICGAEWVSHAASIHKLMTELASGNGDMSRGVHPTRDIFHGMVAQQKRAIASSEGALLIDDLIKWIEERVEELGDSRELRRAHPAPERIAAQVALGYFLPYSVTPRVDFDPEKLLREDDSLGWELVRARAHHGHREAPGARPAEDPDYRFAVVQSEIYRRHLELALKRFDVTPLAQYLRHLARWYLEGERTGQTERVVHTLLDRSARGLGLESGP